MKNVCVKIWFKLLNFFERSLFYPLQSPYTCFIRDSSTGALLWILRNVYWHLFCRTCANDCFYKEFTITERVSRIVINGGYTAQKMKVFIKDFFSKCDQIRRKLQIWSHLLKKSSRKSSFFAQCYIVFKKLASHMECYGWISS